MWRLPDRCRKNADRAPAEVHPYCPKKQHVRRFPSSPSAAMIYCPLCVVNDAKGRTDGRRGRASQMFQHIAACARKLFPSNLLLIGLVDKLSYVLLRVGE